MSSFVQYITDPELVVMVLAAVAAFATVASFVMPLLSGDRLGARMKYVSTERARLRAERLATMAEDQRHGKLRREPKSFMKRVVEQLNLRKALETEGTRERLKMAGFRGQAPVVAFLFFRAILPVFGFAVVFLYLFFVNDFDLAPILRLGLSVGGAYLGFYFPNIFISNLIQSARSRSGRSFRTPSIFS